MNYIKEINAFYDWLETNPLSLSAISLWHALMHINNKTGWLNEFTVSISVLSMKSGLSSRSVTDARKELAKKGRITWKSQSGNQAAKYCINSLVGELQAIVADNRSCNHADNVSDSSSGNDTDNHATLNKLNVNETKQSLGEKPEDKKSSSKKAERVFVKGDLEFTIAVYILNKIREINPGFKKPNIQTWCKDVDAILRIDERDQAELKEVIDWIYDDDFWNDKILSPSKLRKQYDSVNTKRLAEELKGPKQRQIHYFVDDKPAPQRERHLPTPEDLGH